MARAEPPTERARSVAERRFQRFVWHERIDQSAVERLGHAPQCGQLDGSLCFGLFERHQGRLLDPQPLRELRR